MRTDVDTGFDTDTHIESDIDITSGAFARRLGNLLVATRERDGMSVRRMARRSRGAVSPRTLRALEAGTAELDEELVDVVAQLYRADLAAIMPSRLPVRVADGVLSAGGVTAAFSPQDPDSLLVSYLRLVRRMRHLERAPFVDLRRDDVEILAAYLRESGEAVVERLAALMGATRTQRSAMAALFASGAVVIGCFGGAAAFSPGATSEVTSAGVPDPARGPVPVVVDEAWTEPSIADLHGADAADDTGDDTVVGGLDDDVGGGTADAGGSTGDGPAVDQSAPDPAGGGGTGPATDGPGPDPADDGADLGGPTLDPPVAGTGETPADPVVDPPAGETPADPVVDPPAGEVPADPVVDLPAGEVPADPVVDPPVGETPADPEVDPPVDETPADPEVDPPADETPADPRVDETPADPPVDETPADPVVDPPADEVPADPVVDPPVDETPGDPGDGDVQVDPPAAETPGDPGAGEGRADHPGQGRGLEEGHGRGNDAGFQPGGGPSEHPGQGLGLEEGHGFGNDTGAETGPSRGGGGGGGTGGRPGR